jgi:hypothetical protein
MNWYLNIESEVRDVVSHLRNNGINTECSCGHDMTIQCQFLLDGTVWKIQGLLFNYFYEKDRNVPDFTINAIYEYKAGNHLSSIEIKIETAQKEGKDE